MLILARGDHFAVCMYPNLYAAQLKFIHAGVNYIAMKLGKHKKDHFRMCWLQRLKKEASAYAYSRLETCKAERRKDELDSFLRLLSRTQSQNLVNASNSEGVMGRSTGSIYCSPKSAPKSWQKNFLQEQSQRNDMAEVDSSVLSNEMRSNIQQELTHARSGPSSLLFSKFCENMGRKTTKTQQKQLWWTLADLRKSQKAEETGPELLCQVGQDTQTVPRKIWCQEIADWPTKPWGKTQSSIKEWIRR